MEEAQRSIGMAMVFTLVTSIEEWLVKNTKSVKPLNEPSKTKTSLNAENIQITMRGGPVTPETFSKWNSQFIAEMNQMKTINEKRMTEPGPSKLTGRQLFEQNKALATSDAAYGGEVGELVVEVELFEGLEELSIEGEDEYFAKESEFTIVSDE